MGRVQLSKQAMAPLEDMPNPSISDPSCEPLTVMPDTSSTTQAGRCCYSATQEATILRTLFAQETKSGRAAAFHVTAEVT